MLYRIFAQFIFVFSTFFYAFLIILVAPLRRPQLIDKILSFWGHGTMCLHRITVVKKTGEVPLKGPYICMANHQSNLDAPLLLGYASSSLRFVSKIELAFLPIYGLASYLAGNIHVNRKDRNQAISALNGAVQKIKNGKTILVFPEGTRAQQSQLIKENSDARELDEINLLPFKKGGFMIAIAAQVPIIPIGIAGTGKCWPKKSFLAKSGKISLCIGEPISTIGLTAENRDELIEKVQQSIVSLCTQANFIIK